MLYWPGSRWAYFSSSKPTWRQPLSLPKELLVGSMDWLIVELCCVEHDSRGSVDAPKHVYHCVCCSKMTLLFPTCANTAVKDDAWPAVPSPECRQGLHTRASHTLKSPSPAPAFPPLFPSLLRKKGTELQMNSHYLGHPTSHFLTSCIIPVPHLKWFPVLSCRCQEAPVSSLASWKINTLSSSFCKQAGSEPSLFVRNLIPTVSASREIQRERKSVWYNFEIFSRHYGKE